MFVDLGLPEVMNIVYEQMINAKGRDEFENYGVHFRELALKHQIPAEEMLMLYDSARKFVRERGVRL